MKIVQAIILLSALIVVSHAQDVNISGVVKTSGGSGLAGVRVRLGKAAIGTTTATDGSFTIKEGVDLLPQSHHAAFNSCLFSVKDNLFFFSVTKHTEVKVAVYDCKGRLFVSYGKDFSEGSHSITLAHFGSGVFIYRISVNNKAYIFKSVIGTTIYRGPASTLKEIDLAKRAKATSRIDDALVCIKEGYQLYRIAMTNPDSSGLQITMVPLDTATVKDADGNVYKTVRIGNQYWMAENLRTTKYNDGGSMGNACQFYNNTTDAAAKKKWGALYTLNAITSGKLAPAGWHIPSNAEFDTLTKYLIAHGYNYDGTTSGNKIAKSMAATTEWKLSDEIGAIGNDLSLNNASGFSALPGGYWYYGVNNFTQQGIQGFWYTSTPGDPSVGYPYGWICQLWCVNFDFTWYDAASVNCSVRLVRNN